MSPDQQFPTAASAETILSDLAEMHGGDIDWQAGRSFSLVYNADDEGLEELLASVAQMYLHDNGLNPFKYPSLIQVESEVVAWAAGMLGGDPRAGTMSSGGTESIFLACHTARQHARNHLGISQPKVVAPDTVHPAFAKACHYLDLELVTTPHGPDLRADPERMAAAVDDRTAMLVGSAPCYPFGVIDPIPEIAAIASERGILCHTDACLGGWLLPWWERLGEEVPPWDFRVPGVTSISADIHKYGYTFKGASTILYRSRDLMKNQWFFYDAWPGGLYGSTTTAGTRPAPPMVGAWAAIRYLGTDGYMAKAAAVRDATRAFVDIIDGIDGLGVRGAPDMSVFEFGSDTLDIGAVGDHMDDRGWHLDRQDGGLHLMTFPYHVHITDEFAADLAEAAQTTEASRGVAAGYGGVAE